MKGGFFAGLWLTKEAEESPRLYVGRKEEEGKE